MKKAATLSNLSLCFSFWALLLLAALRCSVSFTSPTIVVGFHGPIRHRRRQRDERNVELFRQGQRRTRTTPAARGVQRRGIRSQLFLSSDQIEQNPEEILARRRANSWILLVDDEEPIRRAVGQFFLDKGYQVTTCADGAAALQLALSKRVDTTTGEMINRVPDCIVSDIRMPVMDGLELLRKIRTNDDETTSELSHVPVVLLTAKGLTQDRIAGYDSGADAYLSKPFAPEELVAIVDNVIQRSDNLSVENEDLNKNVGVDDLKRDLDEIKNLLLNKGGGGIGNGWVEQTNVFLDKDERVVLDLLSRGLMTKEIAAKTHLSTRRIEQLLTGMFRKTGVKNRTELVRWAVSTGNVD